jgi:pyridoxamine 5'-phosphate oxidase
VVFPQKEPIHKNTADFGSRGGYVVTPDVFEFWQGQTNRIHDRIRFRKLKPGEIADNEVVYEGENGWVYERLAP